MLDRLVRVAHWIAAFPRVYDVIQWAFGYPVTLRRLKALFANADGSTVLEIGAGTGLWIPALPPNARYLWTDPDPMKLAGYRGKYPNGQGVVCDATMLPFRAKSVDRALIVAVAHHLTDEQLTLALAEVRRVTKSRLVLLDPLANPHSLFARILWGLDRGSFPRSQIELDSRLDREFEVLAEQRYRVYHSYWLCEAQPRPDDAAVRVTNDRLRSST